MSLAAAEVFFKALPQGAPEEAVAAAAAELSAAAGLSARIAAEDFVAMKVHVGERNNDTHVPPVVYRCLGERVKALGGRPFLTETSTLYRGERSDAVSHIAHAHAHGFTLEATGMPMIMADGLAGNSEAEVAVPGELNTSVKIAREILMADALVCVSHITGHLASGFGAAIKNLGMGLASRMGKMRQHSAMRPEIKTQACTFCQKCITWCPEDAIVEKKGKAFIRRERCIGCGECVAVCRFDAVKYNWGMESALLEKHMAEHALGAIAHLRSKCLLINVAMNMTRDCDCMDYQQKQLIPDLGVLASTDPVAVDQAGLDLIQARLGKNLVREAYPHLDGTIQLAHGEKIGLGSRTYQLTELP